MRSKSFAQRVTLYSLTLIVISAGVCSLAAYRNSQKFLEQSVGQELLAIVNSASGLLDGDLHDLVYLNAERQIENEEEFELLRGQLLQVKNSNSLDGLGSPLYTLRKAYDFETSGLSLIHIS